VETVGCLFDHRSAPEQAFVIGDRLGDGDETFQVMRCPECGLLFLSPRPTTAEIGQYYRYETYRQEFAPAVEDETTWLRRWNRRYSLNKLCHFIDEAKPGGGTLLDVGCGTGNFLAQMRAQGAWTVYGLDTNQKAVEYAKRRFQLQVFHGVLEDASYPPASFDVVTLWNVLEHLHDPIKTLQEVRRVLCSDGVLILSIPNGESLDARLFGPHWIGLDPPRHLYTFARKTLETLLLRTGFRMRQVRHITGSYHSFVFSTQLLIRNSRFVSGPMQSVLCHLMSSWLVHILIFPYLKIVDRAGRGSILSVQAEPIAS